MTGIDPQELDPARILRVAASVGLRVEAATAASLATFGALFLRWNERINLGGRLTPESFVDRHLVDAFVACQHLREGARVVDVGSGGGLPAIPLAVLAPTCSFELYEPTAKKVAFLRTALRELDLASRVHLSAARIEPPVDRRLLGAFDVACSRATLPPGEWLALGRQLVKQGGQVVVFATGQNAAGLEPPTQQLEYGEGRRLLLY